MIKVVRTGLGNKREKINKGLCRLIHRGGQEHVAKFASAQSKAGRRGRWSYGCTSRQLWRRAKMIGALFDDLKEASQLREEISLFLLNLNKSCSPSFHFPSLIEHAKGEVGVCFTRKREDYGKQRRPTQAKGTTPGP